MIAEKQKAAYNTRYKVGDRVEEYDECGFSKVVKIVTTADGKTSYLVRQFAHPHKMKWADEDHLSTPLRRVHDPIRGERHVL